MEFTAASLADINTDTLKSLHVVIECPVEIGLESPPFLTTRTHARSLTPDYPKHSRTLALKSAPADAFPSVAGQLDEEVGPPYFH